MSVSNVTKPPRPKTQLPPLRTTQLPRRRKQTLEHPRSRMDFETREIFDYISSCLKKLSFRFEKFGGNPPRRSMTSAIASRIIWAKQIENKVEQVIGEFESVIEHNGNSTEANLIKREHSNLRKGISAYQQYWYMKWTKKLNSVWPALDQAVLRRNRFNGELEVNFDKAILMQVEEAVQITRLGFPVDNIVQHKLVHRKNDYYECFEEMNKVLRKCSNVLEKVPWEIKPMIQTNLDDLARRQKNGLSEVTWANMTRVKSYIDEMNSVCDRVISIAKIMIKDLAEDEKEKNGGTTKLGKASQDLGEKRKSILPAIRRV